MSSVAALLEASPFRRREWWKLLLIFAVALAPRLAFFARQEAENPVYHHPIMDGRYHHEWAKAILTGEDDLWSGQVYFRAPLYPYLLAGAYTVAGIDVSFPVLCQHLLGAATVVLLYLLARRAFREGVAWLAALLAAFYWPFVYFEGDLLIVTTILFLDLLAFLLLDAALERGGKGRFLASGVVFGLSAVARPSILIFFPCVPVALWLRRRAPSAPGARRWIAGTLLVYAGIVLPILPVLVRNWVVGRDFVPIASQAGVNFYIGNNPQSDGQTAVVPGTRGDWLGGYHDTIRMAEEAEGRSLRPSEVSDHFFRKGLEFVVSSPERSIPHLAKKLAMFWGAGERSNNKYVYFFWDRYGLGALPLPGFWLVGPLGLVGALLLCRSSASLRRFGPWLLFVATYSLGVVAFFVNARFRLPVVPFLILFAAYAAFHVVLRVRADGLGAWRVLVLLAVAATGVNLDYLRFQGNEPIVESVSYFTLGNAYLRSGDAGRAIASYEEALEAQERHPNAAFREALPALWLNLGRLHWQEGRQAEGIQALERVPGSGPLAAQAKLLLGSCYVERGDLEGAVRTYTDLWRRFPGQRERLLESSAPGAARTTLERARADAIRRAIDAAGGGSRG